MDEMPLQGDWFYDESMGRYYMYVYDISTNTLGWFELFAEPAENMANQRKVDPPACWKVENVHYSPPPPKKPEVNKTYGIRGVDNLKPTGGVIG